MTYELLEKQLAEERAKVQHLEGMLAFEKSKYELQIASISADFAEQAIDKLEIELQGIEDIIARIDDKSKSRIERYITRIRRKLSEME